MAAMVGFRTSGVELLVRILMRSSQSDSYAYKEETQNGLETVQDTDKVLKSATRRLTGTIRKSRYMLRFMSRGIESTSTNRPTSL